jgi:thioredoxin 2
VPAGPGSPQCARCHSPLPSIVDADDSTFSDVVERSRVPVLVDLWAPWCGPCRTVSPLLEQLATEFAGRLKLVKVNVDRAPGVQRRFGVRGVPTLVLLQNGREVDRRVGASPLPALRSWLASKTRQAGVT